MGFRLQPFLYFFGWTADWCQMNSGPGWHSHQQGEDEARVPHPIGYCVDDTKGKEQQSF